MKKALFFSNYFYGICAIALSIEAVLQFGYPLNSFYFYVFIFSVTVLYYTKAYITEKPGFTNPRSQWYWEKRRFVIVSQVVLTAVALSYLAILAIRDFHYLLTLPWLTWAMLLVFPFVSAFYYGVNHRRFAQYKLRNIGWLKPFIIGFVWAGLVTVYPFVFYEIEKNVMYAMDWVGGFLFIKNFMYITVLCILFDIKDYAADHNRRLKTFVVESGLRKTIFYIVIPLAVLGLASYFIYGFVRHFTVARIACNTVPFILLIAVAYSLHERKSIFYYLIVIDGLMLAKAFFGIVGMLF